MSRAARAALAEDRRRVDKLIADTGTRFQEEAAAKPEMPPEADRAFRAHQLYVHCHAHIVERRSSLWTGEVVGATIAEQWMQNLMRKMQEAAITATMTEAEARERAAAAGLVIPS